MKSTSPNTDMTQTIREQLMDYSYEHMYQTWTTDDHIKLCELLEQLPTSKSYPQEYKPSTSKETVNINDWLEENKA